MAANRYVVYMVGNVRECNRTQCILRIASLYSNSAAPVVPTNYLLTTPATVRNPRPVVCCCEPTVGLRA